MTADAGRVVRKITAGQGWLSVAGGMLTAEMSRHTTFRFCLDPTVDQREVLARHGGASDVQLVIEDLNVSAMLSNHRLARAISDAGWAEFARILGYKQAWRGGQVVVADRWYPSSKLCPQCGVVRTDLTLADRVFTCGCGHSADRDRNAATNLARWGQAHHHASPDTRTPKHGAGPPTPADGTALTDTPRVSVKPARKTREPTFTPHQRPEPTTSEEDGDGHSPELLDTL
ncbi:RNA-guided endonuclease InsQ/TnpB family protein [Mycobacterium sp.]|uniref:RNA-guided endonuclease InsQ/TnpB family protein n=1 Tax=Mycobacterium sp. TaxID=1785 RepID=UPI003F9E81F2